MPVEVVPSQSGPSLLVLTGTARELVVWSPDEAVVAAAVDVVVFGADAGIHGALPAACHGKNDKKNRSGGRANVHETDMTDVPASHGLPHMGLRPRDYRHYGHRELTSWLAKALLDRGIR